MIKQAQFGPRSLGGFMEDLLTGNGARFFRDDAHADEWFSSSLKVPVNILEKDTAYTIDLVIPGVVREDVKLQVNDRTLTVTFEPKEENRAEQEKWLRREFKPRAFKRVFNLSDKIEADKISASYDAGILHLQLPKKEAAVAVSKMIEIQ